MTARFSGEPRTVWVSDPRDDDRRMRLVDPFWFEDRAGRRWAVPAGYVVDGASIPRALWTLIGSPYTGRYRRASIVHDHACDQAGGDDGARRAADRMFFEACRAGGCSIKEAMILYAGVRVGSTWAGLEAAAVDDLLNGGPSLARPPTETALVREYQYVGDEITRPGDTDDPTEVERRTDAAEARLRGLEAARP